VTLFLGAEDVTALATHEVVMDAARAAVAAAFERLDLRGEDLMRIARVAATGAAVEAAARDKAHREVSFSVDVDPQ
jgi:hypothetical protein